MAATHPTAADMVAKALTARFAADLDELVPRTARLGVAVSGGPDSLALLLLAQSARPGSVEAATIDHGLRAASADEAAMVAALCARLGVRHSILTVRVPSGSSVQARARQARYEALADWAGKRKLPFVLTAHHLDDQAETLLMRLARGAGLGGLVGVRPSRELAPRIRLARPLLGWRKQELVSLVRDAGLEAVDDPSNRDPRHERTAVRTALERTPMLDPQALAASASWLGEVDGALQWMVERLSAERIAETEGGLTLTPDDLPPELKRRLLLAAMSRMGAPTPRGPDLQRAIARLERIGRCTLSGLILTGGERWTIQREIKARRRKR